MLHTLFVQPSSFFKYYSSGEFKPFFFFLTNKYKKLFLHIFPSFLYRQKKKNMPETKKSYPFYFGGGASCVAALVVHPFDLTKVRLQNTKGNGKKGMFSTMRTIAQTEGFFKLYNGLSASMLRQATYSTVRFGVYEKLRDYITLQTGKSKFKKKKKNDSY